MHEKGRLEKDASAIKVKKKKHDELLAAAEKEIESLVDAADARGGKFTPSEQKDMVKHHRTRRKQTEHLNKLTTKLKAVNKRLSSILDETARAIAEEDPTGTLFEEFGVKDEAEAEKQSDEADDDDQDEGDDDDATA